MENKRSVSIISPSTVMRRTSHLSGTPVPPDENYVGVNGLDTLTEVSAQRRRSSQARVSSQ